MFHRRSHFFVKIGSLFSLTSLVFWIYYDHCIAVQKNEERHHSNSMHLEMSTGIRESEDSSLKVIIVSYMRSGTSVIGQLFDTNDDAFYVFEPLWYICEMAVPVYKELKYFNGTRRYPPASCGEIGPGIVESYLTCDINNIDTGSLTQVWMENARKTKEFLRCGLHMTCTDTFTGVCRSSTVRVIKTIRMSLEEIKPLLRKYPNLKIIHLVRDPRGIIHSRMKIAEYYHRNPRITAMKVCGDMLRDAGTFKQLQVLFPGRLLQIRYEDFAEEPRRFAKYIYTFLNVTMHESTKRWIADNTEAATDDGNHGTTRANSTETSYKWRKYIPWPLVKNMEQNCGQVYNEYLYAGAKSEEMLRNLGVPLRLEMCNNKQTVSVCNVQNRNQVSRG